MSDIDLTEAVEAATRAIFEEMWATAARPRPTWEDVSPPAKHHHRENVLPAIAAAAPLIERAVREQVAAEIEAVDPSPTSMDLHFAPRDLYGDGLLHAARIARGDS